jgi:hypothetical protein
MHHATILVALSAAITAAAPVPKPDPETERITKAYGAIVDPVGCKLSVDENNSLTAKIEKARPPKKDKSDAKDGAGFAFPQPCGVSFVRQVKGEFTAVVKFRLKKDIAEQPDTLGGVSVGLEVEYPTGESANLNGSFNFTVEGVPPFKRKLLVPGFSSYVSTGKDGGRGKGSGGGGISGLSESILGPVQMRVRCTGKKLILDEWTNGKWVEFDSLTIKEAGEAKLTLSLKNYSGDTCELLIEKYEVK